MDASLIDSLARSLSVPGSRRHALGGLLAGLGLLSSRSDEVAAKKKKACPPCKKRKKGKCKVTLPDGTACVGGTCHGGQCVAPPSCTPDCQRKICGDDGCGGSCGACPDFAICSGGACACTDQFCPHGGCLISNEVCCPDAVTGSPCPGDIAGCYCVTTTEGTKRCHPGGQLCTQYGACTSSSTCPPGTFCSDAVGYCYGYCLRLCTTPAATSEAAATGTRSPLH